MSDNHHWAGPPKARKQSLRSSSPDGLQMLEARVTGATIDRKEQILRGVIIAEAGPFKDGRGEFDTEGLRQICVMINAESDGVRSRFGHPSITDGIGTFLGRVKNAKLGTVTRNGKMIAAARGDLHFNPAAAKSSHGDLIAYVMEAVKADSSALSASLVIRPKQQFRDRGQPPLWFPEAIQGLDLVDVGAATGSLLAAG